MPEICGAFYKKYPQVGVTVDVGNTGGLQQLLEKLKKGALDLVLGYDYDENEFEGIPLHNERLIFVIHKDTQGAAVLKKCSVNPNCRKFCCGSACSLLQRKINPPASALSKSAEAGGIFAGTPEGIRIPDLSLRRRPLYPAELRAHI